MKLQSDTIFVGEVIQIVRNGDEGPFRGNPAERSSFTTAIAYVSICVMTSSSIFFDGRFNSTIKRLIVVSDSNFTTCGRRNCSLTLLPKTLGALGQAYSNCSKVSIGAALRTG